MAIKRDIIALLRKAGLVGAVKIYGFIKSYFHSRRENRETLRNLSSAFPQPPLWLMFDAYGHTSYARYENTGRDHATAIYEAFKDLVPAPNPKILEWGCGPGRIIRFIQSRDMELHGCDYNPDTITWLKQNYPRIGFRLNGLLPPLPYESAFFNVVYCVSVFTHLSEQAHGQWINEIRRVLKPGGVFIATFQGDAYRGVLSVAESEVYEKGNLVVRSDVKEGSLLYSAFHPRPYLENVLFKDFEILSVIENPAPALAQVMWVVRKPA